MSSGPQPARHPAPHLVELRGLARAFGGRNVVGPIDLRIRSGERMALVGPNGSGKSTILRCVAGTLTPTAGRVTIAGLAAGSRRARSLIGVSLSQERSFDLRLSGHMNLILFARLRAIRARAAEQAVARLEEELELEEIAAKPVASCSTGMTQQLSFARSLLGAPRLLLLDEPTRSLDDRARTRLWAALGRRPELGLLVATHREDDVAQCHETFDVRR